MMRGHELCKTAADMAGMTLNKLYGQSKERPLARTRQVISYILHEVYGYSYPQAGRAMNMDYTACMYAAKKFAALLEEKENAKLRRWILRFGDNNLSDDFKVKILTTALKRNGAKIDEN